MCVYLYMYMYYTYINVYIVTILSQNIVTVKNQRQKETLTSSQG